MAVRRLVRWGFMAAGAYGAWRALQPAGGGRPGASGGPGSGPADSVAAATAGSAATLPDQSSPLPPEPTGGAGGGADLTARASALDGTTTGPERDVLAVPSAHGPDPARGADVEGAAGSPAAGTRGDDPLTGVTEPASALPEGTASPDGTPAAGPVQTRRVGEDPA